MTRTEFVKIKKEILKLKAQKKGKPYICKKIGIEWKVVENIIKYGTEYAPEEVEINPKTTCDKQQEQIQTLASCNTHLTLRLGSLEDKVKDIDKWINESVDVMNDNIKLDMEHAKTIKELVKRVKALEDTLSDKKVRKLVVTKEKPYDPWNDLKCAIIARENIKVKVTPEQSKRVQELCFKNGVYWIDGDRKVCFTKKSWLCITNKDHPYGMFFIDRTSPYNGSEERQIILN